MDRAIVERAVQALAALNAARNTETRAVPARASAPSSVIQSELRTCENQAPCGSPHCAGCYEVEPGMRIHPPRCGEEYRAWLEKWEARGRVQ